MDITRRTFAASAAALTTLAFAQAPYPSRPITIIVPYPPGGSTDILARLIGPKLSTAMGVPVVIDNRAGAGGVIGTTAIARAAPDGYTIGVTVPATQTLPAALSRKLAYDPIKDLTPLSLSTGNPLSIVVRPELAVNNMRQLVDYARRNPGKLSYGTSGAGSSPHMVGEMLNQFGQIDIVHIPYKGGGNTVTDLLGGQIDIAYVVVAAALPQVKAGRLKMLAVVDDRRYPGLPDVPTTREALPGFEPKTSWQGIVGPARMPADVVARLSRELRNAVLDPEVSQQLIAAGLPAIGAPSDQFELMVQQEIDSWKPIVKAGNLTASD